MVVRYNSLNRLEKPKLTLCSPGSTYNNGAISNVVGILTDYEAEEVVFNFNATSELNFRINRIRRESAEDNEHTYALFKSVQNRRLVFMDDIGYFMITSIDDGYQDGTQYKDVRAQSIDVEIQQKMIPYIEDGTYRFSTDELEQNKGIFETIIEVLPLWTIGHVDSSVASKWRTFEDVDTSLNCLAFLLENIQDAYECIVLFDIVNRTINVYDQNNYVVDTSIHITKDDVIDSIDITENADDLYTAISVLGDENVTISAINPTGTNVIYNFDYYLEWMSDNLREKVIEWRDDINAAKSGYYDMNLAYYQKLAEANNLQAEIDRINMQITMYQRCKDNIVASSITSENSLVDGYNEVIAENGGTPIVIYQEIADTLAEIEGLIDTCENERGDVEDDLSQVNQTVNTMKANIDYIHETLSIESRFTDEEYAELANYIFEGSYSDEYVTITDVMSYDEKFEQMKTLYDRAEARLERVSSPTQEFNIDVESFIFEKDFEHWSEQLETGCLINVELEENDVAMLFLSNITVNYDDHSMSMTFGNRFNKFDTKSLFDDVLGNISKSANTLSYIKEILYPIKSGEFNYMKEALQTSRDLTMAAALASNDEEVVIDGSGYTGKTKLEDGTYDPRQVKITGRTIVFTDDAWETCKVAIGELLFGQDGETAYGINANAIIGDIIMGNNLRIIDSNGNDLLSVVDGKISASVEGLSEDVGKLQESAELWITQNDLTIAINSVSVDHVTTTTGYTFNEDGLTIHKSGSEITNRIDNTGMYVERSSEAVLTANNEGVNAMNLTARQFLIIGNNSRFENYSIPNVDENRTACFYIGS
ncbi:MAG: hypothetical protein J6Y20_13055 [Lachnospiraceae bacterium]|nr:hypothetical protein [Lachnospiraceae bacterium]